MKLHVCFLARSPLSALMAMLLVSKASAGMLRCACLLCTTLTEGAWWGQ